ncbi:uncharacterized protein LOC132047148 isoform X2 [Lycium ferocissimum]|uniref:uncharacterized protein LOC132047148 isoform X2 n=1 Tax=Lycium ferocissimum TaxID=112874 RepID=UPI002816587A|nr:uncharacterized protein LOC132047148 isoform X2 [Lycium ferocissimum]
MYQKSNLLTRFISGSPITLIRTITVSWIGSNSEISCATMAEVQALIELDDHLTSAKVTLTTEESKLLDSWKQSAVTDFCIGAAGASVATWLGAGWFYGKWRFYKSVDSGVELILSQQGTRLQKALGEIMLMKYQRHPPVLQHVSKYFYSENVYDDDSTDKPKPRWRFRSTYGEIFSSHRTADDDSSSKKSHSENTDMRKTNLERKQMNINGVGAAAALESTEDPFDCILGHQVNVEENDRPDAPGTLPRRRNHSHRRSHGRRRMHRHEKMEG